MDKLQQAVNHIKTGDKATGKHLLVEILRTEPNNELAWFGILGGLIGGGIGANKFQRSGSQPRRMASETAAARESTPSLL